MACKGGLTISNYCLLQIFSHNFININICFLANIKTLIH